MCHQLFISAIFLLILSPQRLLCLKVLKGNVVYCKLCPSESFQVSSCNVGLKKEKKLHTHTHTNTAHTSHWNFTAEWTRFHKKASESVDAMWKGWCWNQQLYRQERPCGGMRLSTRRRRGRENDGSSLPSECVCLALLHSGDVAFPSSLSEIPDRMEGKRAAPPNREHDVQASALWIYLVQTRRRLKLSRLAPRERFISFSSCIA